MTGWKELVRCRNRNPGDLSGPPRLWRFWRRQRRRRFRRSTSSADRRSVDAHPGTRPHHAALIRVRQRRLRHARPSAVPIRRRQRTDEHLLQRLRQSLAAAPDQGRTHGRRRPERQAARHHQAQGRHPTSNKGTAVGPRPDWLYDQHLRIRLHTEKVWAALARLEDIQLWSEALLDARCEVAISQGVGAERTRDLRGGIAITERWLE